MKTEKQKMLAGEIYDGSDPDLLKQWYKAQDLCFEFNNTKAADLKKQQEIIKKLMGSCGKRVSITAPFHCDYGQNIHLGENCEINFNCTFLDCNTITIGKNALIAPNVQMYAVGHPIHAKDRMPSKNAVGEFGFLPGISKPISIGDNVWIGGGTIIVPGVSIGDNVTIGAGSVVTKNIPSNCVAVGNPCRVIREL